MKNTLILTVLICFLFLSFNTRDEFTNILKVKSYEQNNLDSIIDKYYVIEFKQHLKLGLKLLKNKPNLNDEIFEFDFQQDGNIQVKDLTELRLCGVGVLYFTTSKWKKLQNNRYEIIFKGGYYEDSTFEIKSIYTLADSFDSKLLKTDKILINRKKIKNNNFTNNIVNTKKKRKK